MTPDGTSKDQQLMEFIAHNSMKVDGMSIHKCVAEHSQYFEMLRRMEASPEFKRKR